MVGRIGNAETGEGEEEGRFYRQEKCPWMSPVNVEGKVAAHALSVVYQRQTKASVGWALTVPRGGSSLWGNPARMSAMEVIVWGGAVRR